MNSKRWLIVLLCVLMLCVVTACRGDKPSVSQPSSEGSDDLSSNESPNAGAFGDDESSAKPTDNEFDAGNWFDDDTSADSTTTTSSDAGSTDKSASSVTTTTSKGTASNSASSTTGTSAGTTTKSTNNDVDGGDWFGDDTTTTAKTTTTTTVASAEQTKVGKVSLPATGYDPDGKGRIQIGEVSYDKPMVTIEVKNVTTKWMTEETDYLEYTCYDKKGNKLTSKDAVFGKLYIGALRAGKSVTKSFSVPNGTVRVEITGYKLTYWTEWA